jgi:hypothetical protein
MCRKETTTRELACIGSAITVESIARAPDLSDNDKQTFEKCADKWWDRAGYLITERLKNN